MWTTTILEDDPETNSLVVRDDQCPECKSDEFEIVDEDYHED